MITKLITLTGGEEESAPYHAAPQPPTKPTEKAVVLPAEREQEKEKDDLVTSTMRKAIRAAVDITNNEIVAKEIPVMGLGGVVLEIGKVIFEAKMAEEGDDGSK